MTELEHQLQLAKLEAERDTVIEFLAETEATIELLLAENKMQSIKIEARDRLIARLVDQNRGLELENNDSLRLPPLQLRDAFAQLDLDV